MGLGAGVAVRVGVLAAVLVLAGCADGTAATWWQPEPGTTWQIQLQGEVDTDVAAAVFDVDLFDTSRETIAALHAAGRNVICYFSAGSHEDWRPDADAFAEEVLGLPLEGWPGERWVDIRRLHLLGPILEARLDLAVDKGCDAVDPDNVDGYTHPSGFDLAAADQLAFNRWLAGEAHRRGLAIGLKNDLAQIPDLVADFDFAVNEECFHFGECALLTPFLDAGKAVLAIDYSSDPSLCAGAESLGLSLVFKDWDLGSPTETCP